MGKFSYLCTYEIHIPETRMGGGIRPDSSYSMGLGFPSYQGRF